MYDILMSFPLFVLAVTMFSFSSFLFPLPPIRRRIRVPRVLDVYKRRRRSSRTHIQQLATAR